MELFKARTVNFDSKSQTWVEGSVLLINKAHVIHVQTANLGDIPRPEGMGEVFWVSTTIDNAGYVLRVTSEYLESLMGV